MQHMSPVILAIESSCDETSASVISNAKVLNNIIASQAVHGKYGGVVPELASRAHQQRIVEVVKEALDTAHVAVSDLHAVAFTRGPGLLGSLMVGVSFAKGLAIARNIPLIEVNHMHAHVLAHFIEDPRPSFPFLCLTVSGGHTQLVIVRDYLEMEVIGQTQDDAVGEAFDKGAKILGLPYPGGPMIDSLAKQGDRTAFTFSQTNMPGLDFSFSGIKTSFLYFVRDRMKENPAFIEERKADLCASLQQHLVGMLMGRLIEAVKQTGITEVALAGGVSANSFLRSAVAEEGNKRNWNVFIPAMEYCTDNAAMIAMAAHFKYMKNEFCDLTVTPLARMPLSNG